VKVTKAKSGRACASAATSAAGKVRADSVNIASEPPKWAGSTPTIAASAAAGARASRGATAGASAAAAATAAPST
jgi:hypothetical protein